MSDNTTSAERIVAEAMARYDEGDRKTVGTYKEDRAAYVVAALRREYHLLRRDDATIERMDRAYWRNYNGFRREADMRAALAAVGEAS